MEDVKCRKQEANDQPIYIEDTPLLEGCGVKHCDRLVLLFKRIVFEKMSEGIKKFNDEYVESLKTEDRSFKLNVFSSEISINLQKYKQSSKIDEGLEDTFQSLGINLTKLTIGWRTMNEGNIMKWLYKDNKSAIESFTKWFKSNHKLPTYEQLQLVILFHLANQYNSMICESSIFKFILSARRPMIEKQYLALWINIAYGVNLASITTSSINQPNYLEESEDIIQIRLIALICLFYNIKPTQISSLQLNSIVYIKPHFWLKSHWGNFILLLPQAYSSYINKLVIDTETCDKKSCSKTLNKESFRSYWYHNKNRIFLPLRIKIFDTMNELKESSMLQKNSFSEIYNDPLSYIRALEKSNFDAEENYPAYLAVRSGIQLPRRLQDSGFCIISNNIDHLLSYSLIYIGTQEAEDLFEQVFIAEKQTEIIKTRAYDQYCDVYKVNQDFNKPTSYSQKCQCNHSYEIKIFEKSVQIDKNPEMESKIKEIQSLYFQ